MIEALTFGEGWAAPEPGFRWSTGQGATVTADIPSGHGDLFLELRLNPYHPPGQRLRRLQITLNGHPIGTDSLEGSGTIAYAVSARINGPQAHITLHHDAAPSPAATGPSTDTRALGFMLFALRFTRQPPRPRADITALPPLPIPPDSTGQHRLLHAATGLTPAALAERFESLGHNCEFGMFQRHLAAEPLGLLRFAGITLDDLLAAFDTDFEGLDTNLTVATHPTTGGKHEYLVQNQRLGLSLHTARTTDSITEAEITAQYRAHLPVLANHLRSRMADGTHIHVFQRPGQLTQSQALPLWNRLQSRGPNALLYVDQDPNLPSGAVEQLGHGLFHGKLAAMAPHDNVGLLDLPGWLSLCANTQRLWAKSKNVLF
jgi:hypothetical protein